MRTKLQVIHSVEVAQARKFNQHEKESIATRVNVFGASRRTIAREYGVREDAINEIIAEADFERGRKVGLNQARFCPPMGRAA